MDLTEVYERIRPSVVAIVCPDFDNPLSGHFPRIIGTGFAVAPHLIATNEHVLKEMQRCSREAKHRGLLPEDSSTGWCKPAVFHVGAPDKSGAKRLTWIGLEVLEAWCHQVFTEHDDDPRIPKPETDIGFLRVNVRDLPHSEVISSEEVKPGRSVATLGYPMGLDGIAPDGHHTQFDPFLQEGIVSAVLPSTAHDHRWGLAVNIMIQGGASGSPLFLTDQPRIVGIMNSILSDFAPFQGASGFSPLHHRVPTNISYAISGHYLTKAIEVSLREKRGPDPDSPSLEDLAADQQGVPLNTRPP